MSDLFPLTTIQFLVFIAFLLFILVFWVEIKIKERKKGEEIAVE